jgi:capsular exopolysaccharide synthesis family protein
MAKSYEALRKAEAERAHGRGPQGERNGSAHRNGGVASGPVLDLDLSRLDPRVAEEYDKLRGNLFARSKKDLRTVMVVGSNHGEGTTTTCSILATLLARANIGEVALVDANLRTPSLHELFALPRANKGLTDLTTSSLRSKDLVQPTLIPHLSVISAGRPLESPAAIYQEPIASLLADLRADFRYIMLDCSPVDRYSDASFLAANVDGIVLVLRSEVTRIETAIKTKRQLEWAGGQVIGTVLNGKKNYIPLLVQRFL